MAPRDHLRVLIVCGSDLRSPSEKQALWLATHLARHGHETLISLMGDPGSAAPEGATGIDGVELRWHRFRGPRLRRIDLVAATAFGPDLIHAWNPRVPVVAAARAYAVATGAPVLVHWEDDEWGMPAALGRASPLRRGGRLARRAVAVLQPSAWYLATAASIAWATEEAAAFDALTPVLARYVTERTGRDTAVILPTLPTSAPESAARAAAPPLPERIEGKSLVTLTGALIPSRIDDLRLALEGVASARARGADLAFVLAGRNLLGTDPGELARRAGLGPESFAFLGHVPYPSVPPLLNRSSALLAVSHPTSLNVMCLPSKLQTYLGSGTPTIVSAHGAGELFTDEEVLKLERADPDLLGHLLAELLLDEPRRRELAARGSAAARRVFDPETNTEAMLDHYRESLRALP